MNVTLKIRSSLIYYFIFLILVGLNSCFKDEDSIIVVPQWQPGDPQLYMMEYNVYNSQEYFHFDNGSVYGVDMTTWDLGFACSDTAFHIIINPATRALAADIGNNFFP